MILQVGEPHETKHIAGVGLVDVLAQVKKFGHYLLAVIRTRARVCWFVSKPLQRGLRRYYTEELQKEGGWSGMRFCCLVVEPIPIKRAAGICFPA